MRRTVLRPIKYSCAAFCLSGLLAAAPLFAACTPITAQAAARNDSPEFARTPQEWERLRDNRLEYDEIPDLIHEYNTTVINNRIEYRDYRGKDRKDTAQRYRDTAREIRENISYPDDPTDMSYATMLMAAQTSETTAKNLEEMADNNVDDAQVISMQYEQVEENLVLSTRLNLISYYQKLLNQKLTEENQKLLELQYEVAQNQAAAGTATQLEVLNARQAIEQQSSTIINDSRETETLKQQICLATGWSYNAEPEFGPLPDLDPEVILQIDLEADRARALETNYTLKINRRKYENSTSERNQKTLEETIRDNQQKISSDVQTKYNTLLNAAMSFELAQTEETVAAQNLAAMEIKFQTGLASRLEYQQEQFNLTSKTIAVENAKLSLFSAWVSYQGAVDGLAAAQ
ncbi:MAG: TolC family protein [Lachnospiraceae bacterium]|nr:TolC family protein [Lachnospiraceae bacterium]